MISVGKADKNWSPKAS